MEGQSGEEDSRGGVGWRGGSRSYDATKEIKQLLGVPTEDTEHSVVNSEPRSPPQNIPRNRQGQVMNEHLDRSGSPSSRQQWDNHRGPDMRHRTDSYGSPSRNNPKHGNHDPYRPQNRYYDNRHQSDNYGSPGRNNHHRQGSYDRIYGSPRNHHQYQGYQHRGMNKDHRDMRMNGPRPLMSLSPGQMVKGPEVESPDCPPSPEILVELQEQFLFPLKKKSIRFPKAKYFCRLCDYHCDSLIVCRRHIADARHRKLKEAKDVETTLKNVPPPAEAQVTFIDSQVRRVAEETRVSPQMLQQRKDVVVELNKLLSVEVEGCSLEIVGSTISGFCMKTSDINIDVVMEEPLNPSIALLAVRELVKKNNLYIDVLDDLTSSFPTMAFTHAKTGLRMVVGAGSTSSKFTNQLLADYALMDPRVTILGIAFRYWAKLCLIDDQSRGTLPAHVFPLMVVHFLQQHSPPLLPVLHTLHPKPDGDVYLCPSELGGKWQCKNSQDVGSLWLDMFRFYTVGFKMAECIINVRQLKPMPRAEKTWSKKISIEDPFLQKRNLTRTVSGNPVFEYIVDCFKTTYKYLAIPQLSFGPLFHHIIVKEAAHSLSEGSSEGEMEKTEDEIDVTIEVEDDEDDDDTGNNFDLDMRNMSIEDSEEEPLSSINTNGLEPLVVEPVLLLENMTAPAPLVTPSQATKLFQQIQDSHVIYKFEGRKFSLTLKPPLICGSCQKEGHCKNDCREDDLPPLAPLPPMNPHFVHHLTAIFQQLTKDFEPSVEEIDDRDRIVRDLESYIKQFFNGVQLQLFGSSANGFGFQRSDLDICLTFKGNPEGKDIDHILVIESLADKLKRYRQCNHVFAITTAKVPIVKFAIRRACLEGDLSLYNTLALQNTKLLATYANIDHRVKCLGYAMKYFAKLCDIGDASRGSLSSYAYILMVLHFLQQVKPPVIPVLQELYDHSKPAPEYRIDGWNAWFFKDAKSLSRHWKDYKKNHDSVGQLWAAMLRYYTETFNWKEHVVTIRQHAPLTRLQKLWNSRCIAIEDPFDLSHNLGAGLSRKMNTFIMKAFIRGREIFGSPVSNCPPGYRNLVDYLFDNKHFTDGAPPNDRGCRFCGKIGHVQKDCPKKKLTMERRDKKDRQKGRREIRRDVREVRDEKEELDQQDMKLNQNMQKSDNLGKSEALAEGRVAHHPAAAAKGNEDVATAFPSSQSSSSEVHQPHVPLSNTTKSVYDSKNHVSTDSGPPKKDTINKLATAGVPCAENSMLNSVEATGVNTTVSSAKVDSRPNAASLNSLVMGDSAIIGTGIMSQGKMVPVVGPADWTPGGKGQVGLGRSVPPGFQHLGHQSKGQPILEHLNQGFVGLASQANVNQMTKNQPQNPPSQLSVSQVKVPQSHLQQPQQSQSQQQLQQNQSYWDNWINNAKPQPGPLAPKPTEQQKQGVTIQASGVPVSHPEVTSTQQPQQQQYYYSISPAALFHMASQAAGGQQVAQSLHQGLAQGVSQGAPQGLPQGLQTAPPPPPGLTASVPQGLSQSIPGGVPQGLPQTMASGVPQVSMGSALSGGMQPMPLPPHLQQPAHLQQPHYPQPGFPQQGFQMTMAGHGSYYPEYMYGDPALQAPSPSSQAAPPPTIPAEMMPEMAYQHPEVYEAAIQMPALQQFLASNLPQHQNIMSQMSQPHPSMGLPPHHTAPPPASVPASVYTPGSVIYIEGERDGNQLMH